MNTLFPSELLEKSAKERIDYFKQITIWHPNLKKVFDEVNWALKDGLPGSLVFIFGPTGVGKTTLLNLVEKKVLEDYQSIMINNPGILPIVSILAENPHIGNFDWKNYFKKLLRTMLEPLIDCKDDPHRWKQIKDEYEKLAANFYRATGGKYRTAFTNTIKNRETKIKLVDDAQHFGVVASGRKRSDQSNTIKSVAVASGLLIAMFGTYEMLPLRNQNGQVSRRGSDIHFRRYVAKDKRDRKCFITALGTLQRHLPVEIMPDCESHWDFFYERSLGCIGILKDWFTKTLSYSLRNKKEINIKSFEHTALSVVQCSNILSEIIQGEADLVESAEKRFLLRAKLSLDEISKSENKGKENSNSDGKKKNNRKPGERNPKRDKVGIANDQNNISL
ncbi:MAG: ABC transporter ATP-binding protein [Pyrinomonadaceae bacterium]